MIKLTPIQVCQALVVEVIRRLWDRGLYRNNTILQQIHDNWFDFWVEFKTQATMNEVDRQIEEMFYESRIDSPVYWEDEHGETPLGGAMGISHDFTDDNP